MLKQINRDTLLRFAIVISKYINVPLEEIDLFKSKEINDRFMHLVQTNNLNTELVLCGEQTYLELLRYIFSIETQKSYRSLKGDSGELYYLTIILAINEQIVKFNDRDNSLENFIFLNDITTPLISLSQKSDFDDRIIYELESAIRFFEFIATSNYSNLLDSFLAKYHISHWKDYLWSIYVIIAISKNEIGILRKEVVNNKANCINASVLDEISIYYNEVIKYSAQDKNDRNTNSDYRMFRNKPIILLQNGDYFVVCVEFLIDKLYNSLYFDFKSITQTSIDINHLFTSEFSEKVLFDSYLKKCVNTNSVAMSEDDCIKNYNPHKRELGAPDYVIYNYSSIILFECKDIRINGEMIEKHDYETIIAEYKEKLFEKTNKRIGITQLTGHIQSIRNGNFHYITDINGDIIVYPILVVSDYKYLGQGLNHIFNKLYKESIIQLKINNENNLPLVVMSFLTLFKYNKLFEEKGFEFFINDYINHIKYGLNQVETFDWYMSEHYQSDVGDIVEHIIKRLLENEKQRYSNEQ